MAAEHPFAQYVRILGRGPGRSRALTFDEARDAMRMIVAGAVEPVQIGAMLMLMRYRQESPEELAGFVAALRESFYVPAGASADLDWPSYAAGRTRGAPWFLLSALLLAQNGVRILMHGPQASKLARALPELGLSASATPQDGATQLAATNFAFLPLASFAPALQNLLSLRAVLGLRSPANSVARLLNPFAAPAVIQGVFHPAYRELQRGAGVLLGQPSLAVFKGGGGEAERNPDKACRVYTLGDGVTGEMEWPPLAGDASSPAGPEPTLAAIWRGERDDNGVARIVVATAATALYVARRAATPDEADRIARDLWARRERTLQSARSVAAVT